MTDIIKILNNLRRQCSRREYCVSDVMKKAEKALEGNREKATEVVQMLVAEKYVDDLRYCEAYAREKSSISGWGETKIKYMLSTKGISTEVISQAMTQIDHQKSAQRLERLIENKYRTLKNDPQWKLKLLRFALGRGYTYDEINEQIQSLMLSTKNL